MSNDFDVIVVGAGLAGLRAATAVRARGLTVRVLEREASPGGRIRTDVSATLFLSDPSDYDGGELVIEEEIGTVGSMLSKRGRRGFLLFDGVRYEVTSIHRDQNGGLAAATPLGYRFDADGRTVGAVDLNGTNKTLFVPRDRRARC